MGANNISSVIFPGLGHIHNIMHMQVYICICECMISIILKCKCFELLTKVRTTEGNVLRNNPVQGIPLLQTCKFAVAWALHADSRGSSSALESG